MYLLLCCTFNSVTVVVMSPALCHMTYINIGAGNSLFNLVLLQVTLEKVLGISTASGSGLTSDPNTGLIAYPAG